MTQILGKSTVSTEQCEDFLHKVNPNAPYLAHIYKKYCNIYGIRLECAWVQMCLETNYLRYSSTSITTLDMHNYAGLGALDGNGRRQALSFSSEDEGVKCHIQHLYAYCSSSPLPFGEFLIDPRFKYVTKGIAPNIEDLGNGVWASDRGYASKLLNLLNQLSGYGAKEVNNESKGVYSMSSNKIISYDFGHMKGSADGGSVGYLNEYDVVRQYGLVCVNELKNNGYTLIDCTPVDGSCSTVMESLSYRARKSNESGAYLHLCFHANCVKDATAHGAEVMYSSSKGAEFAQSVLNEIVQLGFKSRGIKNPPLYMTGNSINAISILLEPFFVSNSNECSRYNGNTLGKVIATGVLTVLNGGSSQSYTDSPVNRLLMVTNPLMYGQDVVDLQTKLNKLGCGLTVDGYYGTGTAEAVANFQTNQVITNDGIVGEVTLSKLNSVVANLQKPTPIQPAPVQSQFPPIDYSIPNNPYVTLKMPNGLGYIESVPEKGRINIHLDRYNYLVIQDDPVEGNRVWIQTRTKGSKQLI